MNETTLIWIVLLILWASIMLIHITIANINHNIKKLDAILATHLNNDPQYERKRQ